MNQGTPWTLKDHQMDPKMDPIRLNLGDPCPKKTLQGPYKVHIINRPLHSGKA